VIALIDPAQATAEAVLERKRNSFVVEAYENTKIYPSLDAFAADMTDNNRPHAFVVGSPPAYRGSTQKGRDVELSIHRLFPENTPAIFLEKPLSTDTPAEADKVAKTLVDSQTVISVGYFLRYLRGEQSSFLSSYL